MTNGEMIKALFPNVGTNFSNVIDLGLWWDAEFKGVDVLDKIKAEINQYGSIWVQYQIKGHTDRDIEGIVEDVLTQAKQQVLDVIDKYRDEVSE